MRSISTHTQHIIYYTITIFFQIPANHSFTGFPWIDLLELPSLKWRVL